LIRRSLLLAAGVTIATAASAHAQSAIIDVVRDGSGAVLVTVGSARLIEGSRAAVTDNAGSYPASKLRPGEYSCVRARRIPHGEARRDHALPTSFTATLVGRGLSVKPAQESITVTGVRSMASRIASPIGDDAHSGCSHWRIDSRSPADRGCDDATPDVGGTQVM
jgi:hypothetical protein